MPNINLTIVCLMHISNIQQFTIYSPLFLLVIPQLVWKIGPLFHATVFAQL